MLGTQDVKIEDVGTGLIYVTISVPDDNRSPREVSAKAFAEIDAFLQSSHAEVVQERLYGSRGVCREVLEGRAEGISAERPQDLPKPTYVEGNPVWGIGFAGAHVLAAVQGGVQSCSVSTLSYEGCPCGRVLRRFGVDFLFFSDVGRTLGISPTLPRAQQTRQIIEGAEHLLEREHLDLSHVIRTWFYLDDILDWYDEFNQERNKIYTRADLFGFGDRNQLPASTGIEAKSPTGLACTLDLIAIRSQRDGYPEICRLSNPRQNEAFDYGSAFSRGAYLREQGLSHVYVSGTAAIDEEGQSLDPRDVDGQVERTLLNVRDLLGQVGLSLPHMRHTTAFFKPGTDPASYQRVARRLNLPDIPTVSVIADVCRPDLVFEVDGEAVALI